jgi:hypothetical protein
MSTFEDRMSRRRAYISDAGTRSFIVGQNRQGAWVACETHGLAGGIFVSRDAARHYAEFETDHRPGAIHFASRPLELKV